MREAKNQFFASRILPARVERDGKMLDIVRIQNQMIVNLLDGIGLYLGHASSDSENWTAGIESIALDIEEVSELTAFFMSIS